MEGIVTGYINMVNTTHMLPIIEAISDEYVKSDFHSKDWVAFRNSKLLEYGICGVKDVHGNEDVIPDFWGSNIQFKFVSEEKELLFIMQHC